MKVLFFCVGGCAAAACLGVNAAHAEPPTTLLERASAEHGVARGMIQREVEVALRSARTNMAEGARDVVNRLKMIDQTVVATPELTVAERADLRKRIAAVLREASRRATEQDAAERGKAKAEAAKQAQRDALSTIEREQERITQLVDRFNALIDEQKFELAAEVPGTAASDADGPLARSLTVNSRLTANQRANQVTRVARQQGVVATLHQAELAHIPQSDDPPIVYIEPALWQELTLRRAGQSTDMSRESPSEKRIQAALEEQTAVEFVETPFGDVIDYLKDRHGIEIQLDGKSLEEIGVDREAPVTINLRGITLRSTLKLMLRQFELTYTISDEVLLITTPDVAAMIIVPRVHRVHDIVLPIQAPSFTGGFGNLGGTGNNPFSMNQQQNNGMNPLQQNNGPNGNPFNQNGNNFF